MVSELHEIDFCSARNDERSSLVLRRVRGEVDEAYRNLTLCVEALSMMETDEAEVACNEFIGKLNVLIGHTNNILAQRREHDVEKEKEKEEEQKPAAPNWEWRIESGEWRVKRRPPHCDM